MDPQYAIDLWGLRRPFEVSRFLAAIREHLDEITTAAVSASLTVSWSFASRDALRTAGIELEKRPPPEWAASDHAAPSHGRLCHATGRDLPEGRGRQDHQAATSSGHAKL